jgi:hypothetical protein
VAVTVTVADDVTEPARMGNDAEVCPAGTTYAASTGNALELLEVSVMLAPPVGAAVLKVIVKVAELLLSTASGLMPILLMEGKFIWVCNAVAKAFPSSEPRPVTRS